MIAQLTAESTGGLPEWAGQVPFRNAQQYGAIAFFSWWFDSAGVDGAPNRQHVDSWMSRQTVK